MGRSIDELIGDTTDALRRSWQQQRDERLELLRRLVNVNSHADNVGGVDACRAILVPAFADLGFSVEEVPPAPAPRPRAAHLLARRPGRAGAPKLMLIAHLDTVFPTDDPFQSLELEDDELRGPGVGDIKGGLVTILSAAAALDAAGLGDACDLTVVANSDEELGSHASRDMLRRVASGCDLALGFEPAFHAAGESVRNHSAIQHVVKRKGCGRATFDLVGVAAHAGGAHHLGASAIEALARKVIEVHALTDRASGVTTNVGIVSGGRSVNTIAPAAHAQIDFRYLTAEDGERTAEAIRAILEREERVNPDLDRAVTCSIEPGGGALWPPLLPTDESMALSKVVCDVTAALGLKAEPIERGGASDAAHAAAMGRPAICGLGPLSHGIHTDAEHTSIPALGNAVVIAAGVIAALGEGGGAAGRRGD